SPPSLPILSHEPCICFTWSGFRFQVPAHRYTRSPQMVRRRWRRRHAFYDGAASSEVGTTTASVLFLPDGQAIAFRRW
ncbi:unnamed protein product, partial [Linum tenue]